MYRKWQYKFTSITKTPMNPIDYIKGVIVTGSVFYLIYYTLMLLRLAVHLVILELEVSKAI
jgi:hypothetical protein